MGRLITIALSHYCEKARWGLQRCGVPFVEDAHPAFVHFFYTVPAGARRTVPAFITDDGTVLPDSTDILHYADGRAPMDRRLYPDDPAVRADVEQLEDLFDEKLGPHTRRMYYGVAFDFREMSIRYLTINVRRRDELAFRAAYPLIKRMMKRGMNITPDSVKRSQQRVHEIAETVAMRLADGRKYLAGDRFTAADLTFASLAYLLVDPPELGVKLPRDVPIPDELQRTIDTWRKHPAGKFVLRMYAEHRNQLPARPASVVEAQHV